MPRIGEPLEIFQLLHDEGFLVERRHEDVDAGPVRVGCRVTGRHGASRAPRIVWSEP